MSPIGLESRLASWLRAACGHTRWRESRRQGAAILVYHSLVRQYKYPHPERYCVDLHTFRSHLSFVRRRLCPIPLSVLLDAVRGGSDIDPRWIVITLDDALRCQATLGAEVLAEFHIPWSIAIPAGVVEGGRAVWTYELAFLIHQCWNQPSIPLPDEIADFPPGDIRQCRSATLDRLRAHLASRISHLRRKEYLDDLIDRFGRPEFEERFQDYGAFTSASWRELNQLAQQGVEVMCHGYDHLPQTAMLEPREIVQETSGSRTLLLKRMGILADGFALPGGFHDPRTERALKETGFRYCLTSFPGRVDVGSSLFRLPRIDSEYPLPILRQHMLSAILEKA